VLEVFPRNFIWLTIIPLHKNLLLWNTIDERSTDGNNGLRDLNRFVVLTVPPLAFVVLQKLDSFM
jgi:hypothetical protein